MSTKGQRGGEQGVDEGVSSFCALFSYATGWVVPSSSGNHYVK